MVKTNKRRDRTRRQQACAAATCGALLMLGGMGALHWTAPTFGKRGMSQGNAARVAVIPVVWHTQTAPSDAQPTPSVRIDVDVSRTEAADLNALKEALAGTVPLPGVFETESKTGASGNQTAQSGDDGRTPAWFAWGHLNGGRISAQVVPQAGAANAKVSDALGVYAVQDENGATVCLVNKTNARLLTNTRVRLPRGVYRIERLTIGKEREKAQETQETTYSAQKEGAEEAESQTPDAKTASLPPVERLERLEGGDLGSVANVGKRLCLEPGQVCLYRYTDVARAARAAWNAVFAQLRDMSRNHPGPARRLGTMLHEADGYVSGVRGGGDPQNRLGCIHHLLLVTAQAHSLHHNYQMRHTVNAVSGKAVLETLNSLTDALSETSAVLLGLVPQVAVTSPSALPSNGVGRANRVGKPAAVVASFVTRQKEEKAAGVENGKSSAGRTVTIALANTGSRSISKVKIGLNAAEWPSSVTCDPADPAYFGDLHPGQTVRATFQVRGVGAQAMPNSLLTGDVSYFAGTAPAHLRPHAW